MVELHWTEIDRVTTIWTDAPAPLRAGLLFRTGSIDETLATAGRTHLIEHMALAAMGDSARDRSGFVGGAVTGFVTLGQPQEVCSLLANICTALASLPGDRLESEKQVLAAENAARRHDFRANLLAWRYGAVGYGLLGMPQLGIRQATLEQLREQAAERFTDGNAVLWLSGPPPADLHLGLPRGTKRPLPPLVPIQQTFPSWFVDDACGGIAAGALVPRVSGATLFCELASRRLRQRLRTTQAVSYAPAVFYDPLNADTAHLVLYADSDKDHRMELVDAFGKILNGLGEVDEAEMEAARKQIVEHWTGPLAPPLADRHLAEVQRAAMGWILGQEFESTESLQAELLAVTADDVAAFGRQVHATALLAVPGNVYIRPWFGKRAPHSTVAVVHGRETSSVDAPIRRERLVYGPEGVSVVFPDRSHFTVRYSELAAALYYEDGGVRLIGSDALNLVVEPTLWQDGPKACRDIRERVPAHLFVGQSSRPAEAIPKPKTTAWQRLRARLLGDAAARSKKRS